MTALGFKTATAIPSTKTYAEQANEKFSTSKDEIVELKARFDAAFKEELIDCLIRPSCLNQIFISPLSSPSPEIQAKLSEILRTYESSDQWVDYAIRPDGNVVFAEDKPYIKHSILSFISADATRESLRELIQDHQHTGMAGFIHPLSAAGEFKITVVNGKRVIVFNNASGHYRPSPQQTNRYLVRLALQHLVTQALGEQLPIVFVAAKE